MEKRLNLKRFLDLQSAQSSTPVVPHFDCLYSQLYFFGHYPAFMTIGEDKHKHGNQIEDAELSFFFYQTRVFDLVLVSIDINSNCTLTPHCYLKGI